MSVTEVLHPLVQHKLSYLRDRDTPTVHFRKLVEEVTLLLTYEATKDLPSEDVEALRARAVALCDEHPLYAGFRGYTTFAA